MFQPTNRKRKCEDNVSAIRPNKSRKRDETTRELDRARQYAQDGNRQSMELCIESAKSNQEKLFLPSLIDTEVNQIRSMLQCERAFHARQCQKELDSAKGLALEGDRQSMNFSLDKAHDHAEEAGSLFLWSCRKKDATIRKLLTSENEVAFHERCIQRNFKHAERNARAGNNQSMKYNLKTARDHAEKVTDRLNDAFWEEDLRIRGLLTAHQEFHRDQFQQQLQLAAKYTLQGNTKGKETALEMAQSHAIQAGCWDGKAQEQVDGLKKSHWSALAWARALDTPCAIASPGEKMMRRLVSVGTHVSWFGSWYWKSNNMGSGGH